MVTSENKKVVLVVDDNRDAADTLALLLNKCGCRSFIAYATIDGLHIAQAIVPDIIFHDLDMPVMDGFTAGKTLRADARFEDTLIVAVTAHDSEVFRQGSRDAGFDLHLTKPFGFDSLKNVITQSRPH